MKCRCTNRRRQLPEQPGAKLDTHFFLFASARRLMTTLPGCCLTLRAAVSLLRVLARTTDLEFQTCSFLLPTYTAAPGNGALGRSNSGLPFALDTREHLNIRVQRLHLFGRHRAAWRPISACIGDDTIGTCSAASRSVVVSFFRSSLAAASSCPDSCITALPAFLTPSFLVFSRFLRWIQDDGEGVSGLVRDR